MIQAVLSANSSIAFSSILDSDGLTHRIIKRATERLSLLGLPFLFFIDAAQGRAAILYRRYDGHCGFINPSG